MNRRSVVQQAALLELPICGVCAVDPGRILQPQRCIASCESRATRFLRLSAPVFISICLI
jgi:hypothetical protein